MAQKKYVSLSKLQTFLDNLNNKFAALGHTHTVSDISNYVVDDALSSTSSNPVQNKVVDAEFEAISTAMDVLESTVDGKADSSHEHSASDITSGVLSISKGGTEATDGATGLANLFAAGETVLSSYQYGTELPTVAQAGQIFFVEDTDVPFTMEKIWENASPTSAFAAQTIELDLSEYDEVEVWAYTGTGNTAAIFSKIPVKESAVENTGLHYVYNYTSSSNTLSVRIRKCIVTVSGIEFATAYGKAAGTSGSSSSSTEYIIPFEIYGIKRGVV